MKSKPSFILSFVDLITCALGGVLVIFFTALREQQDEVDSARGLRKERDAAVAERDQLDSRLGESKRQNERLRAQAAVASIQNHDLTNRIRDKENAIAELRNQLGSMQRQVDRLAAENARILEANEALSGLQRRQAREVIGLSGAFNRVAFVFDTSGSMEEGFDAHKALLSLWLARLDFEQFNVISFADEPSLWTAGWEDASDAARRLAGQHVSALKARGNTATLAALDMALKLPDVDTIVFFSDGAPSDAEPAEILEEMRNANQQNVVINVIAIGDYFQQDYGTFLRSLAQEHGGQFLGR